jgi:hypothetical protein
MRTSQMHIPQYRIETFPFRHMLGFAAQPNMAFQSLIVDIAPASPRNDFAALPQRLD